MRPGNTAVFTKSHFKEWLAKANYEILPATKFQPERILTSHGMVLVFDSVENEFVKLRCIARKKFF